MAELDIFQIPNNSTEYELRDNRFNGYAYADHECIIVYDAVHNKFIPSYRVSTNVDNVSIWSSFNTKNYVDTSISKLSIPTKTSELTNDSNFQNGTQVSTAISTAIVNKEDKPTVLTGTLTAGSTSITLSSTKIVDGSRLDYYISNPSIPIRNVTVAVGSVTLTFDAQSADLGIEVVVR